MYNIKFIERFSYPKTSEFWRFIDNKLSYKSPSYSVILRDRAMFLLSYSYGLLPEEIINLKITDFNFDCNGNIENIFTSRKDKSRLIHTVFCDVTNAIESFIKSISIPQDKLVNNNLFISQKKNFISLMDIKKRFKFYNSKLPLNQQIKSIYSFRQFYIADLLRIKGISQPFANSQIGNNIIDNQMYYHLLPNNYNEG